MGVVRQLELADKPDAVRTARHFTTEALAELGDPDLVADAEVIVSELVTNAMLHALPPVLLLLELQGQRVRIEVSDRSPIAPMRSRPDPQAMTGRGVRLIESLSVRWGVTPTPGGKTVWAELEPAAPEAAAWSDPAIATTHRDDAAARTDRPDEDSERSTGRDEAREAGEPTYTVALGDVPTDLLLAAKAHVDNLVREFTLAAAGAESGSTAAVPPHLASLIETVVHGFADARQAIKRQAVAAADAGAVRTHLSLTLPVSAAAAGDAYLAALDEVDSYARAARLLTLETPPQHRAFRRWYVQSLILQLRAIAAGEPAPTPQSFEQRLLDELETVARARHIADRAARLQNVTSALSGATTVDEVTSVVVRQGLEALGASAGSVLLRTGHDHIAVSSAVGYGEQVLDAMRDERVDAQLPGAAVLRGGDPVWLESRREIEEFFPGLGELEPRTQSLCAIPAATAAGTLGALRFSFSTPRLFDEDERRFVLALAAQAAAALDRGSVYAAEQRARAAAETLAARLSRLQRITSELAVAVDPPSVATIIVTHAQDALGALGASLCLFDGPETLRIAAARGVADELVTRFRTFGLDAGLPAAEAVRTDTRVIVADADEMFRRYPELARARRREGSVICAPLHSGRRRLGVLSLQFAPDHEASGPDELAMLTSLVDASSQAIDRAQAQVAAKDAADRLTFLADVSAELGASLDYRATLGVIARRVVPQLADWCAMQIVDGDRYETVTVAHVDPAMVAFAAEVQRRYPIDPDAPGGVPNVVRTGKSVLYPNVTDEMLEAGTVDEEHLRITRELGLSSVLIVPLTGHGGTFGALTLVYAESGRHYGEADRAFAEEVARRAGVAVENARQYQDQSGRLAAITRIAEAAQHAILAPVPPRAGPVQLAGAYVSAASEALVGGDLYEVIVRPESVRLLIGDVRGKGLAAVRLTTVVLGYFRALADDTVTLAEAARRIDARLAPHLGDEDFVTAMFVEIHNDGRAEILSCGHPGPLLADADGVTELSCPPALPLGLGSDPQALELVLQPGNRLLLYTDGLIEARDADGRFADLMRVVGPLRTGALDTVLEQILDELRAIVGGDLDDDLAMIAAEYHQPG